MLDRRFASPRFTPLPSSESPPHPTLDPPRPRRALLHFLRKEPTVLVALCAGIGCVVAVTCFTSWLSQFTPLAQWPSWAVNRPEPSRADVYLENLNTVQGIVTLAYSTGLLSLAYFAHAFSESALWPLLNKQRLSIEQIQTYLNASRGSIPATPFVLLAARNVEYALVVIATLVISFIPLTGTVVVGNVYNTHNESVAFTSETKPGGGIGLLWRQTNPPGVLRDKASSLYGSWSHHMTQEPMPQYREWFVDRTKLSDRGDFSVNAVKIIQDIDCRGVEVPLEEASGSLFAVKTEMHNRSERHDAKVLIRDQSGLSVWAHNYTNDSDLKTTLTLIFAAVNGHIDQGVETTKLPDSARNTYMSSLACDISVEFVEHTLTVANSPATSRPHSGFKNKNETINQLSSLNYRGKELALWTAASPIVNGSPAFGAQPIYRCKDNGYFTRYTSTTGGEMGHNCSVASIKQFIKITTGALLLGEHDTWPLPAVTMTSYANVRKLDPERYPALLAPPLAIIGLGIVLALWNAAVHASRALPGMRLAQLSEVLERSCTVQLAHAAAQAARGKKGGEGEALEDFRVRFTRGGDGDGDGGWGLRWDGG